MSELSPREKRSIDELYGILAGYRREIDRIARAQDTRLTTLRAGDGAGLTFVDDDGNPLLQLGGRGAGVNGDLIKYLDGPVPEAPGEPLITGGAGVIHVTLGDGAEPSDAKLCRVHASLEADFEPSAGTMIGSVQPGHRSVSLSIQAGTWYCCVQWLTLSGKESEVSPVVSVEVDAMVDLSDLDEARAEADQRWADFAVREQEFRDAIASAEQQLETVQGILDQLPDPADFDTVAQQIQDAIDTLGDVSQRLQDAEAALEDAASKSELNQLAGNMSQLDADLAAARTRIDDAESSLSEVGSDLAGLGDRLSDAEADITTKAAASELSDLDDRLSAIVIPDVSDLATRAELTSFAADAQHEYDRLQELAEKALSKAGDNQLEDPSFETMYWANQWSGLGGRVYAQSPLARTGDYALSISSGATWHLPFMSVPVEPGESWRLSVWYRTTNVTSIGNTRLRLRNGGMTLAESEPFEISPSGYTRSVVTLTIPEGMSTLSTMIYAANSNGQLILDDASLQEVGAAAEALRLAEVARQQAEAAHVAAGTAISNSDAALTMAGSKSKVTYSTSAPSGTAAAGDTHRQRGSDGSIIAEWEYTGSSWQRREISSEAISNLDVGKLTAGSVTTPEAVISKLWADGIVARAAEFAAVTITSPDDFAPGPGGYEHLWEVGSNNSISTPSDDPSGAQLRVSPAPTVSASRTMGPKIRAVGGDEIYYRFFVGTTDSPDAPLRAYFLFDDSLTSWTAVSSSSSGGWVEGTYVVRSDVTRNVRLGFSAANGSQGNYWIRFLEVRKKSGGHLTVDGTIDTRHLNVTHEMAAALVNANKGQFIELIAQDLIAGNATFISAAMQNLTVTERAQFAAAFAQEIWAELGVFDRLEAESAWIGGAMLGDGEIVARHITGSESLVTKILGFETAVADNLVLNQELWARSATIINAVMQTLSVTEKANFVDAFAEQFMANSAVIRELLTSRLVVSAENFAPDPSAVPEAWNMLGVTLQTGTNSTNGVTFRFAQRSGDSQLRGPIRPVRPGDTIRVQGTYTYWTSTTTGASLQLRMEWFTDPTASRTGQTTFHTIASGSALTSIDTTVTVPDGAQYARFYVYQASTSQTGNAGLWGDLDVRSMVGGELLVDGTLKTRKLDVDEIWANSTWQNEAHFGAEDATYRTLINGQGVEVFQKGESTDEGDSVEVPVVQLGTGGDNAFSALVEGEVVGGIGQDGTVTGARVISADDALVAGYPVFGKLLFEEIPSRGDSWSLLDQLPRGVVAFGSRNMNGVTWGGLGGQGFLELSFDGIWDRQYRLNIHPWQMSGDKNYFQRVVIRYDGNAPGITDTTGTGVQVWNTSAPFGGSYLLSPNNGTVRVLIGVYTGNNGLTYSSTLSNVHAWIEDIGSRVESSGLDRHSTLTYGSGGGETGGGNSGVTAKKSYHSAWTPSWMRSFMSGGSLYQTRGKGAAELRQGRDQYWPGGGIQTSAFGGFTSSAIAGETSRTISSALSGATLDSGSIELRGSYVPGGGSAVVRLHWHTLSSMPGSYTSTANHIGDYSITAGGSRRIALPAAVRTAIKNGTFGGFGLNPRGSTSQQYALGVSWNVRPVLRLKYTR